MTGMVRSRPADATGFGLAEALVAVSLLAVLSVGVARLVTVSRAALWASSEQTMALLLAVQKLEQLRSLRWSRDRSTGRSVSDVGTDLTVDPPTGGGRGLSPSPADSLERSRNGFADYLDARGRWVGQGAAPPTGTAFVRRWAVGRAGGLSGDRLVLQVVVLPYRRLARAGGARPGDPGVVWLVTLRGRR